MLKSTTIEAWQGNFEIGLLDAVRLGILRPVREAGQYYLQLAANGHRWEIPPRHYVRYAFEFLAYQSDHAAFWPYQRLKALGFQYLRGFDYEVWQARHVTPTGTYPVLPDDPAALTAWEAEIVRRLNQERVAFLHMSRAKLHAYWKAVVVGLLGRQPLRPNGAYLWQLLVAYGCELRAGPLTQLL